MKDRIIKMEGCWILVADQIQVPTAYCFTVNSNVLMVTCDETWKLKSVAFMAISSHKRPITLWIIKAVVEKLLLS